MTTNSPLQKEGESCATCGCVMILSVNRYKCRLNPVPQEIQNGFPEEAWCRQWIASPVKAVNAKKPGDA